MDRDKLKIMIKKLNTRLSNIHYSHYTLSSSYKHEYSVYINIITHTANEMDDLRQYLKTLSHKSLSIDDVIDVLNYILEIMDLEESYDEKIEKGDIFQSAKDKISEAAFCLQREDYPSTINNLNTGLELLLKEKFDIPTTIQSINTSKIIDIAVKHNQGPIEYLKQAKKFVSTIDNEIKHRAYKSTKVDCVRAMKAMEELATKLETSNIVLTNEIKEKIYSGI